MSELKLLPLMAVARCSEFEVMSTILCKSNNLFYYFILLYRADFLFLFLFLFFPSYYL